MEKMGGFFANGSFGRGSATAKFEIRLNFYLELILGIIVQHNVLDNKEDRDIYEIGEHTLGKPFRYRRYSIFTACLSSPGCFGGQ